MSDVLAESYAHCHAVTRTRARNFYYGMKLTPEPKRSALYAIYAWMRQADDLADESGAGGAKLARLERLREQTDAALAGGHIEAGLVWPAFIDTAKRYDVPRAYLHAMIDGQVLDQRKTTYANFDELYDYCYKVASVVGLTCIGVWGYEGGEETRRLSEWRGIAFQLTNILRDVDEDDGRDRTYLPQDAIGTGGLGDAVRQYVQVARDYYEKSAPLDARVHPDGRPCLWAMTRIYRGLLDRIARRPDAVLAGRRVRLPSWRKAMIAFRASRMAGAST